MMTGLFFLHEKNQWLVMTCLFLSTILHGILDAFTNGGLGVGFLIPFDNDRYFFSYRPIQVSPIGIQSFFSKWGWRVILSELVWIGVPGLVIFIGVKLIKKR